VNCLPSKKKLKDGKVSMFEQSGETEILLISCEINRFGPVIHDEDESNNTSCESSTGILC
jgi:hypothetical protein